MQLRLIWLQLSPHQPQVYDHQEILHGFEGGVFDQYFQYRPIQTPQIGHVHLERAPSLLYH